MRRWGCAWMARLWSSMRRIIWCMPRLPAPLYCLLKKHAHVLITTSCVTKHMLPAAALCHGMSKSDLRIAMRQRDRIHSLQDTFPCIANSRLWARYRHCLMHGA